MSLYVEYMLRQEVEPHRHTDLPSLAGGVQGCLKPAKVTGLEVIVDADNREVTLAATLVNVDCGMASVVACGDCDTLGVEVDKSLESELVYAKHARQDYQGD